jgi:hypothetical protein
MKCEALGAIAHNKIIPVSLFSAFVGIGTIAPIFHQQVITGTIVNATLFAATYMLGIRKGVIIGLIPSIIALLTGILPPALAPMVPYIGMSNVILVLTFGFLKNHNEWLAIIMASLLKTAFIYLAWLGVTAFLLQEGLAHSLGTMMSWSQLFTALAGGTLAIVVLRFLGTKSVKLRE